MMGIVVDTNGNKYVLGISEKYQNEDVNLLNKHTLIYQEWKVHRKNIQKKMELQLL